MRLLLGTLALTVLAALTGPDACAQSVQLTLSAASGNPGDRVLMDIALSGEARPAGLQWTMNYPGRDLTFDTAEAGPSTTAAGKSIQCHQESSATTCLVVGFNQDTIPPGIVATITFAIAPATRANSAAVTLSKLAATSPEGESITLTGTGNLVAIRQGTVQPTHQVTAVLDAASFLPLIAPGAIVSIFGDFAEVTSIAPRVPLGIEQNGFSATFNGIPGAIFGVFGDDLGLGFNQANVQVPWDLPLNGNPVQVRVHWEDGSGRFSSDPFLVEAGSASPGIFEFPIGSGQAIVVNFKLSEEDDVVGGSLAQPGGAVGPLVGQPAAIGGVITIWLNGLGPVTPPVPTGHSPGADAPLSQTDLIVRVLIGDVEARIIGKPVLHPTLVGLNQINAFVGNGTPTGNRVPIIIEVESADGTVFLSKADTTIAVRAAP